MPLGRLRRLLTVAGIAIPVLVILAAPAADARKGKQPPKPTVKVGVKLPPLGHAAFTHAVFKVKKPAGKGGKKAGASAKGGKGSKAKVKAKIRKPSRLPRNAIVLLRVGKSKKKANVYAADALVINSTKQPGPRKGARASEDEEELQPGDALEIELTLTLPDGTVLTGTFTAVVEDGDINEDDPPQPGMCGEFGNAEFSPGLVPLSNALAFGGNFTKEQGANLFTIAEGVACDEPIAFDQKLAEDLLAQAGWTSSITPVATVGPTAPACPGKLGAAPPPFEATEADVEFACNLAATSIAFELPGGRFANGYIAPPQLPECVNQVIGENRYWLFCQGGTLPANTNSTARFQPFPTQLGKCDSVKIYLNPQSLNPASAAAVTDTDAFATCP
jgi:hypothetical protein